MLGQAVAERVARVFARGSRQAPDAADARDPAITADQHRSFQENGFLILPGLLSGAQVRDLKRHVDDLWTTRADRPQTVIDCYYGLPREERTT